MLVFLDTYSTELRCNKDYKACQTAITGGGLFADTDILLNKVATNNEGENDNEMSTVSRVKRPES